MFSQNPNLPFWIFSLGPSKPSLECGCRPANLITGNYPPAGRLWWLHFGPLHQGPRRPLAQIIQVPKLRTLRNGLPQDLNKTIGENCLKNSREMPSPATAPRMRLKVLWGPKALTLATC